MKKQTTKQAKPITIGVLAKLCEVGVETIRFYERKGLICQPAKVSSSSEAKVVKQNTGNKRTNFQAKKHA
jgi:hypothetical protein